MHTPDKNRAESNLSLYRRLFKIKKALKLSGQEWVNLLGITLHEAQQIDYGKKDIKILAIFNLSEKLNLNVDDLLLGKFDIKTLQEHQSGNYDYIPKKYTVGAGSYCRSIINHLDFIEMYHGEDLKNELLAKLQISERALQDKERKVNLRVIKDITKFLRSLRYNDADFSRLGKYTAITYQNSPIGKQLSQIKSPPKIFETMENIQNVYEENFSYRIVKMDRNSCQIEGVANPEKQEMLKSKNLTTRDVELIKAGILIVSPQFANLPNAKVTVGTRTVKGENRLHYNVDYAHLQ